MSSGEGRREGAGEVGGKIKEAVGRIVGSEQLEAEGKAQALRAAEEKEDAKARERAKATSEELQGSVKKKVGAVLGDQRMEAEGTAEQLKGKSRHKANE